MKKWIQCWLFAGLVGCGFAQDEAPDLRKMKRRICVFPDLFHRFRQLCCQIRNPDQYRNPCDPQR